MGTALGQLILDKHLLKPRFHVNAHLLLVYGIPYIPFHHRLDLHVPTDLISHKEWLKRTAVFGRRRSTLLKAVDSNLKMYDEFGGGDGRWRVEQALKAWMQSKQSSGGWVANARNKDGAITELYDRASSGTGPSKEELEAIGLMKQARTEFLVKLFAGTKLKSNNFVKAGAEASAYAYGLRKGIKAVGDEESAGRAQHLGRGAFTGTLYSNAWGRVAEVFRGADFEDILNLPEFIEDVSAAIGISLSELSSGMIAGAGLVKSSMKTIWYTYKTGKSGWDSRTLNSSAAVIDPGDPMAAFKALQKVIERELALNATILSTHAAETGAKASGMFLDGGALTSAAAGLSGTIGRLLLNIGYMARDWKEAYRANQLLKAPGKLDASLFQESPILGCYFLCCADTSMIVSLMFEDIVSKRSFKDVIEHAVKSQLNPTLKIACHALYRHRMRLTGKKLPKLTVLESASNATGDIFYLKATGQIAMREAGWNDRVTARINNLKNLRGVNNSNFY